ncbi:uncharacterized protein LOC117255546 [Epinephelus lanceolatus]
MNPLDWDAYRTPQRNLHPHHPSDVNNIMENTPRTNNKWDTYCEYSRHTVDEAHSSMMGVNVGRRVITPPLHNFYMKEPEVEDPDGEPLEMDEEDPELARKRKELREIEERIMMKKASIALKTVEPFGRKTTPPDYPHNEQSATCKHASLKDRVNEILRQRHPPGFFSKVHSLRERINSSSLSKGGLLQDNHPLKLRVKALMKQRCSDPCVLPESREVPDVTLPSPSQSITSLATKDSGINEGFQRFLSVLNKGVDMDFLSRIVNDDSDLPLGGELLNVQPSPVENKSDPPFRRENQQSNCGASLPGHSQTNSGKKTTDPPSQERPLNERHSLPDDAEKKNVRDFSSSRRSRSPLAGKKRTKKEDEKPKVKEQSEQLQNILKTLGLSLEVEEMSKLADRTQERLYGKKHEDTSANSRGEQESQQSGPQRHYSNSSSSSSSSYSRSTRSRSFSSSPSRSHSRDRKRRSDRSRSRDRSRDELNHRDSNQHSKEEQRYRENKISTYEHPYPSNQMYPHPQPAAYPPYPDYSLSQDSQYTAYHSSIYSHATESYSTHTLGAIASPSYPSSSPYPQNTYHQYPRPVVAPHFIYPRPSILDDLNLLVNPDLSTSEGQTGSVSGPRCLQVISTKQQTSESCLKGLTKGHKRKGKPETCLKRQRTRWARRKEMIKQRKIQERMARQNLNPVEIVEAPQLSDSDSEGDPEAEQPEEEKRPPTEEEVKAKLRKTLEAFNQKVKQKVPQPANSLTSSDQWTG